MHIISNSLLLLKNFNFLKYSEKFLLISLILSTLGLLFVFSASASFGRHSLNSDYFFLIRQGSFLSVGLILFLVATKIPLTFYQKYSYLILLFGLGLLVLVLIPQIGDYKYGARRWFKIYSFGIQPSEFFKFAIIIWLAAFLSRKKQYISSFWMVIGPPLLVLSVMSSLLIMQPDFGAIVLLIGVCWLMMLYAGINWKHLLGIALVAAVFSIIAIFSNEYRLERLSTYLDPWQDTNNSGFQLTNSIIALGNGGLTGTGLGNSLQKQYYLPLANTDFIFSTIAEEIGLLGVSIFLLFFLLLAKTGFKIAAFCQNDFASLCAFGITTLITLQALLHFGVVSGLLPTKGIGLPFISYGGSSLVTFLFLVGIVYKIGQSYKT